MQYQIEVTETRRRIISVETGDLSAAITQVAKQYADGEIVVNSGDFVGYSIKEHEE